ncbi:MAG: hypothetical protein EBU88_17140, partial [Acidobacteria bacterium]|nr:hypothetical protein [Acidobacteriota bacterium]
LQSAWKEPKGYIAKYFDPGGPENLLNTHEQSAASPRPGEIAVTIKNGDSHQEIRYPISKDDHSTHRDSVVRKGDLASDFITYRFFFGFSHFRNSEKFNLWELFEQEILPFTTSTTTQPHTPLDWWRRIRTGEANPSRSRGLGGTYAYDEFEKNTHDFASVLTALVDAISDEAQKFYDKHFAGGDPSKVTFKLSVPKKQGTEIPAFPSYDRATNHFEPPVIEFGIQVGGKTIPKPQSHLNEAKMTQIALSVRFAASLVNLHDSELKLLVLDDLLVSLDMSNRMKVVEILISDPAFANYQKIILTHDLGFFREFRRIIGSDHSNWHFIRLNGSPTAAITGETDKTELQKAEEYLHGHSLEEAAIYLRKAAEETARRLREWTERRKLPPGEFFSLTENLRAARNKILEKIPAQLYDQVIKGIPPQHREHLVPAGDDDVDGLPGLDVGEKGMLKSKRKKLRTLLTVEHWKAMENVELIDEVLNTTDRVLNPGAHDGEAPLYEHEVQKARDLIVRLQSLDH